MPEPEGSVTDFEEKVAEALELVLENLDREHSEPQSPYILAPSDLARRLAPRVAAAIRAAVGAIDSGYYLRYYLDESATPAIAALWGDDV